MDLCAKHNTILDTKMITNKDLDAVYKVNESTTAENILLSYSRTNMK